MSRESQSCMKQRTEKKNEKETTEKNIKKNSVCVFVQAEQNEKRKKIESEWEKNTKNAPREEELTARARAHKR